MQGNGNNSTEVELAVLDERLGNLCGNVKNILKRYEDVSEAASDMNQTVIRLEGKSLFA